jgi:hypothetical protein
VRRAFIAIASFKRSAGRLESTVLTPGGCHRR